MKVEEAQLTDPHTGKYTNGMVVKILDLKSDVTGEPRINESRSHMSRKTKTT